MVGPGEDGIPGTIDCSAQRDDIWMSGEAFTVTQSVDEAKTWFSPPIAMIE